MKSKLFTLTGAVIVSALLAGSQVFLKSALASAEGSNLISLLRATLLTCKGWAAIILTGSAALFWLKVLSRSDLAVVYPLISLSYLFALVLAISFLGEKASAYQWIGVLLVCAGVALVTHRV